MKNMKIGLKLILSFLTVVILASLSGVVGLVVMQIADRNYSEALLVNGFSQGDIGRFNTYLNKGSALVRDMIFLSDEDELKSAEQELEQLKKDTDVALEAVKKYCTTDEEVKQIAIIDKNLPEYRKARDQVVELGLAMKNDEALALFRSDARPYLNACMDAANSLADMNVTMGNEVSDRLTSQSRVSSLIIIIVVIVSVTLSVLLGIFTARSISRPVQEIEAAAKEMADGNLNVSIEYQSGNELGSLSESMRLMIKRISFYMREIAKTTKQLADGNLQVKEQEAFLGDFRPVQSSLYHLVDALNNALGQINQSADQVSAGSDQVSAGAQALSQGSTEQASSVEELAATINEISSQVQQTAQNADDAREETMQAGSAIAVCNGQMGEMIAAMDNISNKSTEIGKIIKTIEDIAFQTNILALNAAVEAARAGAAGKGFAVVADEVRNLASKSAEASKNTAALIEGSIQAVENGTQIANGTADSLSQVVKAAQAATEIVDKIAGAAKEQALSIAQVTQGIDQISSVVQTNSATAEESAAASEELSGQAQMLKSLVGRFELREGAGTAERAEGIREEKKEFQTKPKEISMSKY